MAPQHAMAHIFSGPSKCLTNRATQGIAECEQALALDRNLANAHAVIGLTKIYIGRGAETEAHINEALRLSPRDTLTFRWLLSAPSPSCCLVQMPKRSNGYVAASRQTAIIPLAISFSLPPLHCSANWIEARAAAQAGLALDPTFTIRRFRLTHRATIRLSLPDASASMRACA